MNEETKSSGSSCICDLLGFNNITLRSPRTNNVRSLDSSKTYWPVSFVESIFFPEFKRKNQITSYEFQVVETISQGAFGRVYKVVHDGSGEYALKVLSKAQVIVDNAVKQVKEEVKIQSICGHHPFIVNCPFFWQSKKELFIVTTYVPGGELLQLWYTYGSFPEDAVKLFVAEIALALDFLHNAGVIYRDLKLENILIDADGHIQIIDFGLAKWLKYGARTRTICGTFQYMAPEILRMEPYTHSVDWWSLGVILFGLLEGALPFDGRAIPESPDTEPLKIPSLSSSCSAAAKDLVGRLLVEDPGKRLHSLYNLQGTAFYHKFNFIDVQRKKISPLETLKTHFPNGPPVKEKISEDIFPD